MTAPSRDTLAETIARIASDVTGVAFLRPGVIDLLRGSTRPALTRSGGAPAGVHLTRPDTNTPWRVDVQIVIRHGHRALDVARAVHDAVLETVSSAGPAQVTITVTNTV